MNLKKWENDTRLEESKKIDTAVYVNKNEEGIATNWNKAKKYVRQLSKIRATYRCDGEEKMTDIVSSDTKIQVQWEGNSNHLK